MTRKRLSQKTRLERAEVSGSDLVVTVDIVEFLGDAVDVYGSTNGATIVARLDPVMNPLVGQRKTLRVDLDRVHYFAPASESGRRPGANLCPKSSSVRPPKR